MINQHIHIYKYAELHIMPWDSPQKIKWTLASFIIHICIIIIIVH